MCNQVDITAGHCHCCSWHTLKKNFHSLVMCALGHVTPVLAAFSSARVVNHVSSLQDGGSKKWCGWFTRID
jgi:hypothetical protein